MQTRGRGSNIQIFTIRHGTNNGTIDILQRRLFCSTVYVPIQLCNLSHEDYLRSGVSAHHPFGLGGTAAGARSSLIRWMGRKFFVS